MIAVHNVRRPDRSPKDGSSLPIATVRDAHREKAYIGTSILEARDVSKHFGGQTVLENVSIHLNRGEVVLLRGENGSGKTTLLNILTGNLEPDAGVIKYKADDSPRDYHFPRRWWQELNPWYHFRPEFVAREGVGRTWQDVRLFGSQSLRDNIAVAKPDQPGENPILALVAPGYVRKVDAQIRAEADAILARLGLASRESSSGDMISLGQSKRVAIARAVTAGASILFLDEPLSGLDRQGIADILTLLESLVRERELTLVIVEHVFNQAYLQGLVTTDWLLEKGRILRSGIPIQNSLEGAAHAALETRTPSPTTRPEWFQLLAGDNAEIIDESFPRGATLTRIRRHDRFKQSSKPILEISNLIVNRGPRTVIGLDNHGIATGLNLAINEGEIAILQAPNGWGKSTLIAAIAGLLPTEGGEIYIERKPLSGLPTWERVRKGLRALPSDQNTFSSLTVKETIKLAGSSERGDKLGVLADRVASSLSGGQKQRLALLCQQNHASSKLLVFDEPFSMLDMSAIKEAAQNLLSSTTDTVLVVVPSSTM